MRPGRVQALGAVMLTILLRVLMPWLALGGTAVALLMLTHYACAVLGHVGGEQSVLAGILLPLRALLLATVHSWLFLATVFTFLCHGLNSGSSSRSLHDPSRS